MDMESKSEKSKQSDDIIRGQVEYLDDNSSEYVSSVYEYKSSEDTYDAAEYEYSRAKEEYDFATYEYSVEESEYSLYNHEIKTIDQLKQWCRQNGLPDSRITRFFIGKNYQDIKAFGIYAEGKKYIVYMNGVNGKRTVFYEGSDQGYAVGLIYEKLLKAIEKQRKREWLYDEFDGSNMIGGLDVNSMIMPPDCDKISKKQGKGIGQIKELIARLR